MQQLSIDQALTGPAPISNVTTDERHVYWLARQLHENSRDTVMRFDGEAIVDLTPQANVRSRVMEYGGGAFDTDDGVLAYCDDVTSQVWLLADEPQPLTPPSSRYRYGGLHVIASRRLVIAVREDHAASPEPVTELIGLEMDSTNADGGVVIAAGADFYAGPHACGDQLAWYQWHHPNMSWDEAQVWTAPLANPASARPVFAQPGVSAQHPLWLSDGRLAYVHDASGYWNWSIDGGATRSVELDCDGPTWVLNRPASAALPGGRLAMAEHRDAAAEILIWDPATGETQRPLPGTADVNSLAALGDELYAIVSWPDRPASLERIRLDGSHESLVCPAPVGQPVIPESVWADGPAGPVQAFFYPVPGVARPPMLVLTHGGPTTATTSEYDPKVQFWISRGFAVLDVNYSGSTGFGRAYRDRLRGTWGVLDVADVVAQVRQLAAAGRIDGDRVAIAGGSAGGYTTLQALVTTDVFAAGLSSYGIADLRALLADTHKAESRYLDGLIGPWPQAKELYLSRSPITQLDQLATPMLILQGLQDKVVPPNQAYAMADAVRAAGEPLALVTFPEEGHGFRGTQARHDALAAQLSFLEQVFGMPHSDDIPVLPIERLTA
ncbi:MAG: peptidase [Arachnia propionica]|nr:MAG: peptidase [Arachnia propionica]